MDREQLPFSDVLDKLFSGKDVLVSLVYRLSDMNPEEMEAFEARWAQEPEGRRRIIARHMADISEENFVVDFSPAFLRLLEDASLDVRLAAIEGLWDTSNLAAVAPLISMMRNDNNVAVRAAAASCLGHFVLMAEWGQIQQTIGDGVVNALLEQFERSDGAEAVRRASLESLGNAGHPQVVEYIDDAYQHGGEEMQLSAVFAMGRSADGRWAPIIVQEMRSPQAEMRIEAARAAGGIGHSDTVDGLIELLDDDDVEVQLAAIHSLGQIGSDQAYEALAALMDDRDADELHEAVEEAMDEIEWLGGEMDLTLFEWDEDEPGE